MTRILLLAVLTSAPALAADPPMPNVAYPSGPVQSNMAAAFGAGRQAQAIRSQNGHFYFKASANGATIPMMVDTGATGILLTYEDAEKVGLNPVTLTFNQASSTANGIAYSARAQLRSLAIGGISKPDMVVRVAKAGVLNVSLLGQSFLSQVRTVRISGDALTLID